MLRVADHSSSPQKALTPSHSLAPVALLVQHRSIAVGGRLAVPSIGFANMHVEIVKSNKHALPPARCASWHLKCPMLPVPGSGRCGLHG